MKVKYIISAKSEVNKDLGFPTGYYNYEVVQGDNNVYDNAHLMNHVISENMRYLKGHFIPDMIADVDKDTINIDYEILENGDE